MPGEGSYTFACEQHNIEFGHELISYSEVIVLLLSLSTNMGLKVRDIIMA